MFDVAESIEVETKLYLNGFPKSGTHVLAVMAHMILPKVNDERNWVGNVEQSAFGSKGENLTKGAVLSLESMAEVEQNCYIKGHMAYDKRVADTLQENNIASAFIFRDFRDVAVSAAYHATKRDVDNFPMKWFYKALEFDELLKHIITGDEFINGVMDRWHEYAPWMEEDWVLKFSYEDYLEHSREIVQLFIRYVYGKSARYKGMSVELDKDDFDNLTERIMKVVRKPELSPTYREGKSGKWKEYFTEEHKELFKETDKYNWLIRLGYENDKNW